MIRLLGSEDIPAVMRLKDAAGWNQTEQDWANLLALEPEGCWVDVRDGVVAASTTAVCYGRDLAWIGMVLTLSEYRGRGLARGLMEHCLRWLESRRVRQVKLDATEMGRPLYEKLGFREERISERWAANSEGGDGRALPALPPAKVAAYDRECFGTDRSRLIERLVGSFPGQGAWAAGDGFVLGRPGTNAYFLGPCAAGSVETARRLILELMQQRPETSFLWDLFPDVPAAVDLARELGFERRRELARMALRSSGPPAGTPERVFGAAGFEYG